MKICWGDFEHDPRWTLISLIILPFFFFGYISLGVMLLFPIIIGVSVFLNEMSFREFEKYLKEKYKDA